MLGSSSYLHLALSFEYVNSSSKLCHSLFSRSFMSILESTSSRAQHRCLHCENMQATPAPLLCTLADYRATAEPTFPPHSHRALPKAFGEENFKRGLEKKSGTLTECPNTAAVLINLSNSTEASNSGLTRS